MNAKHIIREEGREKRRRRAGGKQRTEIGKKKKNKTECNTAKSDK